ncbi:hypothetical protein BDQ12DRAFT_679255 [Crucibulum laeve]|uniref:Uncharacterized protein n=1 Tax=Crucibulum laeve TaxID=68775 RepID=A0A5C3M7D8_9AGAR|nr:hypothetical protein BDQ12DRAFT_679255 [Crucibulum laeve]
MPLAESRSPIASAPVPWLSVKLDVTRSPPSCSSASSPSNVLSVRLPRISKLISASSHPPSWLSRKLLRHTLFPFLRTPTWLLSMLSVSLFNPRIWH